MPNLLDRRLYFGGELVPALIASAPPVVKPTRKMTVTQIAGTNREVVEMEYAWETYDQEYDMFVGDGSLDCIQDAMNDVARVVYKQGWQTLADDYEPDYFRLAYFQGSIDTENRYTRLGRFTLSFKCRPEKFLNSGNTPVTVATGDVINNPTAFKAKPLIKITGSGNGTLTVGTATMSFTGITDYLNIDCDTMNVYRQITENRNNLMTGEFPVLNSGNNTVTFTGGITAVQITPRFWVL